MAQYDSQPRIHACADSEVFTAVAVMVVTTFGTAWLASLSSGQHDTRAPYVLTCDVLNLGL